jgi:hypothetical protein
MKLQTPDFIAPLFYFSINTKRYSDDEFFGIAIGRIYLGFYGTRSLSDPPTNPYGWCVGLLDEKGNLIP